MSKGFQLTVAALCAALTTSIASAEGVESLSDLKPVPKQQRHYKKSPHENLPENRKGRSIASYSPAEKIPSGQGMNMMSHMTDAQPSFIAVPKSGMSIGPRKQQVHFESICRDSYGFTYAASTRRYANCVDDPSRVTSSASANDYFSTSQRSAGVGLTWPSK